MPKIIIDSDIYIHFLRTGSFEDSIKALYTFRTRDIYFSSVVAQELLQGALDEKGTKYVETLIRPFEKVGRLVTPTHEDWLEAGRMISKLYRKRKDLRSKRRTLTHDALIATTTRRIGAVLYTANTKDFELLAQIKPFPFQAILTPGNHS